MKAFNLTLLKWASNAATNHKFMREFGIGVVIVHFLRWLTAFFSIWAGYFYFSNVFVRISPNNKLIPLIFAVLLLGIVEFLSAWLITKFTKQALAKKAKRALILLFFAVFTFGLSFYSSTNGLAMRQSSKADNSKEILDIFELKKNSINLHYDNLIENNQEIIKEIKRSPAGWSKGKREFTTDKQQANIFALNEQIRGFNDNRKAEITELKDGLKNDLANNRNDMTDTANHYYVIMSIVLFVSLLSNISLQSFSSIIHKEEKPKDSIKSDMYLFKQALQNDLKQSIANYMYDLNQVFAKEVVFENIEEIQELKEPEIKELNEKKQAQIGFMFNQAKENNESQAKAKNENYEPETGGNRAKKDTLRYGIGVCPLCLKEFPKNSHNHKFCSELHRIEYAEKKTGKNLTRYKNLIKK